MEQVIPSFDELARNNSGRFDDSDYVNFIASISVNPSDVARSCSRIFFPAFHIVCGLPFNESFGAYRRFTDSVAQGLSKKEAYYWSHVTDIEGLFRIDRISANSIADYMCIGWNNVLSDMKIHGISFYKSQEEEIIILPRIDERIFS